MATYVMHVYGEMCPGPLFKVEKRLRELQPGDVLVTESDHSCTVRLMREHLRKLPCRFQVAVVADGIWQFVIERR